MRLSRRCSGLGDYWLAAWLDIDAADVATQLGEISRGLALAEPAWLVLGKPVTNAHAVIVYGSGRSVRAGAVPRLFALLTEARDWDGHSRRCLQRPGPPGDRPGSLWARVRGDPTARRPSGRPITDSPASAIARRRCSARFGAYAAETMPWSPPERDTFIAGIDRILNHASATLRRRSKHSLISNGGIAGDPCRQAEVRAAWDRLGLGQQVRLLMAEGGAGVLSGRHGDRGDEVSCGGPWCRGNRRPHAHQRRTSAVGVAARTAASPRRARPQLPASRDSSRSA